MKKSKSLRAKMFFEILRRAKHGTVRIQTPDGTEEVYGEGEPVMNLTLKNWEVIDLLFSSGDLGLAEAIISEELIVDDPAALIEWACRNDQDLEKAIRGNWYGTILSKLKHFLNDNTKSQAKKNIMAHYDLGNEFYRLWLDPSMSYSSAYFTQEGQDLESAQMAKYDRIIDRLGIRSGDHVLEIGCGWGGFFGRAVERTGCKVTAVLNSPEQARYNREQIERRNYKGHVDLQQKDYRDIAGRFDKVVSIEMIEAVGERHWGSFFEKVGSSLQQKGEALIQGITIRDDLFYSYRRGTDFIQQYVFPGGMLLTNSIMRDKAGENHLSLGDTHEFGLHYADTLRLWRANFERALPHIREMGFDEKFIRIWRLYLSYCEGAFRAGRINVGQFHFGLK